MDYRGDGCEDEAGAADEMVPEVRPQAGCAGGEVDRRGQVREVRGDSAACAPGLKGENGSGLVIIDHEHGEY
jgi:hypothetical protein